MLTGLLVEASIDEGLQVLRATGYLSDQCNMDGSGGGCGRAEGSTSDEEAKGSDTAEEDCCELLLEAYFTLQYIGRNLLGTAVATVDRSFLLFCNLVSRMEKDLRENMTLMCGACLIFVHDTGSGSVGLKLALSHVFIAIVFDRTLCIESFCEEFCVLSQLRRRNVSRYERLFWS